MLKELRTLFRRSLDAFLEAREGADPEDRIAELLAGMRREMVAGRALVLELEEEVGRVRSELESERAELARCERRGTLAERIGDRETVRVAAEFAERHASRIAVLEQRLAASEAELALGRREAQEMSRRYQEADSNRFVLLAELRSTLARQRMRSALDPEQGPAADFARMEERVLDEESLGAAYEEVERESSGAPGPPRDVEERLRELKRRLGRQGGEPHA